MSETNNVATLVPSKPDKELAEDFKKRLVETYQPVMTLMDEIHAAGFDATIGTSTGPLGKQVITALRIVKVY